MRNFAYIYRFEATPFGVASFVEKKDEVNSDQKKQDAREQGKNKYMGDGGKNRPGAKVPKEGTVIKKEKGGFDFRV